jgi:hypothetical protein
MMQSCNTTVWQKAGVGAIFAAFVGLAVASQEYKSGIVWPEPKVIDPGPIGGPPADAVVLFDGKDLAQWNGAEGWAVEDGVAVPKSGSITSKQSFGDCQLHVEFATPKKVAGSGQGRGNSGIYLMERYEVQILDSYENQTYFDGQCGAIYKQKPPMVNACRKPGEWQSFDILFTAPRFDAAGKVVTPGYVSVLHNGVAIHNHTEILGATAWEAAPKYTAHPPKAPLHVQFHGNPVHFRNIWIRELRDIIGKKP